MPLISKERKNHLYLDTTIKSVAVRVGEEVVSWKRRVESYVTSQTVLAKIGLSAFAIGFLTCGGFTLAQGKPVIAQKPSSFEVYQSIRTAEALAKSNGALQSAENPVLVAVALDDADDYLREIFGTPLPNQMTPAELVAKQPLKPPLPEIMPQDEAAPPDNAEASENETLVAARNSRSLLWPMRGGRVSSRFGMRWGRMHQGTDIAAPHGTPILAAADGKVVFAGWEGGYGKLVVLDHGNGIKTKYGHCSQILVRSGQHVKQGAVIGKVGSTGNSTGPHLHYEVIRAGTATNPEAFTRRR